MNARQPVDGLVGDRFLDSVPRGPCEQAIEAVLQANEGKVKSHLVVDDEPAEFPGGHLNTLFVDGHSGIGTAMNYAPIAAWLVGTAPGTGWWS